MQIVAAGRLALLLAVLGGALISTGVAKTTASDPPLNSDPRFVQTQPRVENGTGAEEGTYLPPIAGPTSEIVGTVQSEAAGPTAFYVGSVDSRGNSRFWRGLTDANGHFHLKLSQLATGLATLLLFKHFDKNGRPDSGAVCQITDKAAHVSGTEVVLNPATSGPAIVEATTAYERGGLSRGVFQMQTRGTDPLLSKVTLDESDSNVDTLAASDRSIVGKLHDDAPLGPHRLGVQSGDEHSNEQPAYVVALRIDPLPPLHTGAVVPVRVHVDGLGDTPGSVAFTITGGVEVAGGGQTKTVPITGAVAECPIRAKEAGAFHIDVVLLVALRDVIAKLPPLIERLGPGGKPGGGPGGGPHVTTTAAPPPTESPIPHATGSPQAHAAPSCKPEITGGWMEPSQGAWQDDNIFDDHPTKQFTRLNEDGAPPSYRAEMDMVTERDTRLFGVHHYRFHGTQFPAGYRGVIVLGGTSDCSDPPKNVQVQFTVESANHGQVLYTSGTVGQIRLTGHHVTPVPWELEVRSDDGIPPWPKPPYRFTAAGPFVFKAEVIADTGPTGLAMSVEGNAHAVVKLKVGFLAAFFKQHHRVSDRILIEESERLAKSSAAFIQDYYPLHSGGWVSGNQPWLDWTEGDWRSATYPAIPGVARSAASQRLLDNIKQRNTLEAELTKRYDALARLMGYDRIVIMLQEKDMDYLFGPYAGIAFSQKTVAVWEGANYLVVAHEIAHTLPYKWSNVQMKAQCSLPGNYHNLFERWAYGVRLTKGGAVNEPVLQERKISFMGQEDSLDLQWVDQCTFWHLADELKKKPDPPVLLVRGAAMKVQGALSARLWFAYDLDGVVELQAHPAGPGEEWAIVLRDPAMQVIGTYPFEPEWADENGKPKNVASFSYQVPAPSNLGFIELRGPGVFVTRRASAAPPVVRISSPAAGVMVSGAKAHVAWSIAADPHTKPVSTVLYSSDGGATYVSSVFEEPVTSADVSLDPHALKHRVKVIVTDGTRSGEAVVDFGT